MQLYQQADVFVLPTLADCFGNASFEAMASGLPVITTAMGGIPDIVAHGHTGYLLAPGSTRDLAAALSTSSTIPTHDAFGVASRQRALALFDSRTNAGRLLDLAAELGTAKAQPARLTAIRGRITRPRSKSAPTDRPGHSATDWLTAVRSRPRLGTAQGGSSSRLAPPVR